MTDLQVKYQTLQETKRYNDILASLKGQEIDVARQKNVFYGQEVQVKQFESILKERETAIKEANLSLDRMRYGLEKITTESNVEKRSAEIRLIEKQLDEIESQILLNQQRTAQSAAETSYTWTQKEREAFELQKSQFNQTLTAIKGIRGLIRDPAGFNEDSILVSLAGGVGKGLGSLISG